MSIREASAHWKLRLYVSGAAPRSAAAITTVRQICDTELAGDVDLEVVDVHRQPERVHEDRITAIPALVRRHPLPERRLVGDLDDADRIRQGLDLAPRKEETGSAP
jgi:circadian clock protein KaiB